MAGPLDGATLNCLDGVVKEYIDAFSGLIEVTRMSGQCLANPWNVFFHSSCLWISNPHPAKIEPMSKYNGGHLQTVLPIGTRIRLSAQRVTCLHFKFGAFIVWPFHFVAPPIESNDGKAKLDLAIARFEADPPKLVQATLHAFPNRASVPGKAIIFCIEDDNFGLIKITGKDFNFFAIFNKDVIWLKNGKHVVVDKLLSRQPLHKIVKVGQEVCLTARSIVNSSGFALQPSNVELQAIVVSLDTHGIPETAPRPTMLERGTGTFGVGSSPSWYFFQCGLHKNLNLILRVYMDTHKKIIPNMNQDCIADGFAGLQPQVIKLDSDDTAEVVGQLPDDQHQSDPFNLAEAVHLSTEMSPVVKVEFDQGRNPNISNTVPLKQSNVKEDLETKRLNLFNSDDDAQHPEANLSCSDPSLNHSQFAAGPVQVLSLLIEVVSEPTVEDLKQISMSHLTELTKSIESASKANDTTENISPILLQCRLKTEPEEYRVIEHSHTMDLDFNFRTESERSDLNHNLCIKLESRSETQNKGAFIEPNPITESQCRELAELWRQDGLAQNIESSQPVILQSETDQKIHQIESCRNTMQTQRPEGDQADSYHLVHLAESPDILTSKHSNKNAGKSYIPFESSVAQTLIAGIVDEPSSDVNKVSKANKMTETTSLNCESTSQDKSSRSRSLGQDKINERSVSAWHHFTSQLDSKSKQHKRSPSSSTLSSNSKSTKLKKTTTSNSNDHSDSRSKEHKISPSSSKSSKYKETTTNNPTDHSDSRSLSSTQSSKSSKHKKTTTDNSDHSDSRSPLSSTQGSNSKSSKHNKTTTNNPTDHSDSRSLSSTQSSNSKSSKHKKTTTDNPTDNSDSRSPLNSIQGSNSKSSKHNKTTTNNSTDHSDSRSKQHKRSPSSSTDRSNSKSSKHTKTTTNNSAEHSDSRSKHGKRSLSSSPHQSDLVMKRHKISPSGSTHPSDSSPRKRSTSSSSSKSTRHKRSHSISDSMSKRNRSSPNCSNSRTRHHEKSSVDASTDLNLKLNPQYSNQTDSNQSDSNQTASGATLSTSMQGGHSNPKDRLKSFSIPKIKSLTNRTRSANDDEERSNLSVGSSLVPHYPDSARLNIKPPKGYYGLRDRSPRSGFSFPKPLLKSMVMAWIENRPGSWFSSFNDPDSRLASGLSSNKLKKIAKRVRKYSIMSAAVVQFSNSRIQLLSITACDGYTLVYDLKDTIDHAIMNLLMNHKVIKIVPDPKKIETALRSHIPGSIDSNIWKNLVQTPLDTASDIFLSKWLGQPLLQKPTSPDYSTAVRFAVQESRLQIIGIYKIILDSAPESLSRQDFNIFPYALQLCYVSTEFEQKTNYDESESKLPVLGSIKMSSHSAASIYRLMDSSRVVVKVRDFTLPAELCPGPSHDFITSNDMHKPALKYWNGLTPRHRLIVSASSGRFENVCRKCGSRNQHRDTNNQCSGGCAYALCLDPAHRIAVCPVLHGHCLKCGRRGHLEKDHKYYSPMVLDYTFLWWAPNGICTSIPFLEPRGKRFFWKASLWNGDCYGYKRLRSFYGL